MTTTAWWTGDDRFSLRGAANLGDIEEPGAATGAADTEDADVGLTGTVAVGSYRPNAFGLHDMPGNVWEWCRDWYGSYELGVREGDGERQVLHDNGMRVLRGGAFHMPAVYARSAKRLFDVPTVRGNVHGVRPARVLQP
jgi:formylglycine-generating enzyme required for sulfatase activity